MIIVVTAIVLLGLIFTLYLLVGLGAPLGFLVWGGKYDGKLPKDIRTKSFLTLPIQLLAIFTLLKLGDLIKGEDMTLLIIFGYVFMIYFFLNVFMNLLSKSKLEKVIMTPTAFIVFLGFVYVLFLR